MLEFPVRDHQNSNELLAPVTEGEEYEMDLELSKRRRGSAQLSNQIPAEDLLATETVQEEKRKTDVTGEKIKELMDHLQTTDSPVNNEEEANEN